jgi:hypothetical protein
MVSHLRAFARNKHLGTPEVVVTGRSFVLKWPTLIRTFQVGDDFSDDDFARLITTLKRW